MPNGTTEQFPMSLPPQETTPAQETTPSVKPKNTLMRGIGVIILAGILGVGVSLATQIWDPLWNPFRPSPEKVIGQMSGKMQEIKTYHTDTEVELNIKDGIEFSVKFSGRQDADTTEPENLKSVSGLNFNIASDGMQFAVGLDIKTIDDVSYFKLTNIPAMLLMGMGIDPSQIKNVWIKFDEDSLREMFGQEMAQEIKEKSEKSEKQQKETIEKLKSLIENKKFYIVKKELPDEKIGNIKTYHYLVSLNKEEIKNILPDLLNIFGEQESKLLLPEQMEGFQQEVDKFFEKVGDLEGELWIGKKDKLLYRFKGEKSIETQVTGGIEIGEATVSTRVISIKVNIDFSNFDQPMQIEAPKDFKTFEEIFGSIFGSALTASEQKAKEARIIADMLQMRSAAEIIAADNNSYSGVSCQETDKGIKVLCDDIAQYAGKKPTIHSSSKDYYCAYVQLLSRDEISGKEYYYCIDSSLRALQTTVFPGGKGYCDGKTFDCPPATK